MGQSEQHFLHTFCNPESVAIVGASNNPLRVNHHLVANLVELGFKGRIYPVNPKEEEVHGLRCFSSVKDIDETVDLAAIAVSHAQTLTVLQECVAKGIKRVVMVAGGFSETGEDGKRIQKEMGDLLRENGMRAIGPNALSPINAFANFAISFHRIEEIKRGGLSFVFQSGLYEPRLHWLLSECKIHLNKLVDLGNKMDINEVDALEYLVDDPDTRVIAIHLESIEGDGGRFFELIREACKSKRVVVLKSGRTEAGARAAASHTGVLVQGNDHIFDAALRQCGAVRAQNIEEFFEISRALERFGSIKPSGNRITIAVLPGGEGVVVTDLCQQEGLSMAEVTPETLDRLRPIFPSWDIEGNPFDLGVCLQFNDITEVYGRLVDSMIEDPNVDMMAMQLHFMAPRLMPKEFFHIFQRAVAAGKPIALWAVGLRPGGYENLEWVESLRVPVFPSPEKAIKALYALVQSSRRFGSA
jgi:acetyltransferase